MIYANHKSAMRARFAVENLSWVQRADKIGQLAQTVYDALIRDDRGPLGFPEYSQVSRN